MVVAIVVVALVENLGSKHLQPVFLLQYEYWCLSPDLPQQSPPSYLQPQLLLSSSQRPSPTQSDEPHLPGHLFTVVALVVKLGSRHLQPFFLLQYEYWYLSPDVPQQSPPSQLQAQLLLSSSQRLSPLKLGDPHLPSQCGSAVVVVVVVPGVVLFVGSRHLQTLQ